MVIFLIFSISIFLVAFYRWPRYFPQSRERKTSNRKSVSRRKTLAGRTSFLSHCCDSTADGLSSVTDAIDSAVWQSSFPHAIIIGVKKGGTRALLSMLGLHPQIRSAPKEIHFFDRDEEFRKGIDHYIAQMPKRKRNQVVVEKTPSYIIGPSVPKRMKETLPLSTKFIVLFREPIERAISDYMQTLSSPVSNGTAVQTFASKVITANDCQSRQARCVDSDAYLIQLGQYARWMQEWLAYYNRSHFLFLSSEELTLNPVGVLNQVETFLGVKPFFQGKMFYFNELKGFYCHRLRRKREKSQESDGCLGRSKGRHHIKVDPDVVNMLQNYFAPWNRLLYSLIDKTFNWNYTKES